MEILTQEQIEAKASELSIKFDNKVTPVYFTDDDEQVIGYFQEPSYDIRMYVTDMYIAETLSKAYEAAINDSLIKEESSPRITSSLRKDAKIKASFTNAMGKMLAPLVDEYKKK